MDPTNKVHLNPVNNLPMNLYANTKFANILFTFELARRLRAKNIKTITVNCLHPGVIQTEIWRNIPFPINYMFEGISRLFLKTLEEGIQTTLYCAMSPDLEMVSGNYYRDCKEGIPKITVNNLVWQKVLYDESIKMVKLTESDPII
jgi:hypothetical protein